MPSREGSGAFWVSCGYQYEVDDVLRYIVLIRNKLNKER